MMRVTLNIFFKKVHVIGANNIPNDIPLIISSNHNNMFVDAAILVYAVKREINFIMAAISAKNRYLKVFLKFVNVILTERPMDHMFRGKGVISKIDGELLQGQETDFNNQLKPGDIIKIKSNKIEYTVMDVLSPTIIKIHSQNIDENNLPAIYDILPKMPQDKMFNQVFERLEKNEAVAIFPEGGSHDQTELLPLKAGACVFVYGAFKNYRKKVDMVEVGIHYFGGHKFRSKVVVNIGKPRSYSFEENLLDSPGYKKDQIGNMLDDLRESLLQVKVSAPTYNELVNLYIAKEIYVPDKYQLGVEKDFTLFKKFAVVYYKVKDKPEVVDLRKKVNYFRKTMKKYGLKISELKNFEKTFGTKTRSYFLYFIAYLSIVK